MQQAETESPTLQQPLTVLKGVGRKTAESLAAAGLETLQDLLFHLPYRYQDRTRVTPVACLRDHDVAVVEITITASHVVFARKRSLIVQGRDLSGEVECRFFHFNKSQQAALAAGKTMRLFGECRQFGNKLSFIHPEYKLVEPGDVLPVAETLTPVYRSVAGFSQRNIAKLISQALTVVKAEDIPELLPSSETTNLHEVLSILHHPTPDIQCALLEAGEHPLQRRLILEELVAHQCAMQRLQSEQFSQHAYALQLDTKLWQTFYKQLPFQLTNAQQRVLTEIGNDLSQAQPMQRLLQGDVGAGKTIIALLTCLHALANGKQAAMMAPTEILAEQHYLGAMQQLAPLGIEIAWLSGKLPAAQKRATQELIATGKAQLIIGTHALLQKNVTFADLAVVVIDEQHRFGVHQRLALCEKGGAGLTPHQLVMTATPIPRTLAMTAFAHLHVSLLDELPPGRTPVKTIAIPNSKRDEVIARIQAVVSAGRQVYWVCTLIEESEALQCQAAQACYEQLQQALPVLKLALIHGRLKSQDKEAIMQQFASGDIDVLVATTVIEVGVNVPNASLMVIENPERLGLAQLHQLRGRVGRGSAESFCVLLYQTPLSRDAKRRLHILRETNDGFVIAEEDLSLRGPGEVLGTRQTGVAQYRLADLLRDADLLADAQKVAKTLLKAHDPVIDSLINRWLKHGEEYGKV